MAVSAVVMLLKRRQGRLITRMRLMSGRTSLIGDNSAVRMSNSATYQSVLINRRPSVLFSNRIQLFVVYVLRYQQDWYVYVVVRVRYSACLKTLSNISFSTGVMVSL
jgi:hypothetical protein